MAQVAQIERLINAAQKVIGGDVIFKVNECRSCPIDSCHIMLCDPQPTNEAILPLAKQGSYFFNRIGRPLPIATAAFGELLPILDGGDDRQRSNSGGLPFRMRL